MCTYKKEGGGGSKIMKSERTYFMTPYLLVRSVCCIFHFVFPDLETLEKKLLINIFQHENNLRQEIRPFFGHCRS